MGARDHGVQDPALEPGDPSVDARLPGLSTADAPAHNPSQVEYAGALLAGQGAPGVTLGARGGGQVSQPAGVISQHSRSPNTAGLGVFPPQARKSASSWTPRNRWSPT